MYTLNSTLFLFSPFPSTSRDHLASPLKTISGSGDFLFKQKKVADLFRSTSKKPKSQLANHRSHTWRGFPSSQVTTQEGELMAGEARHVGVGEDVKAAHGGPALQVMAVWPRKRKRLS